MTVYSNPIIYYDNYDSLITNIHFMTQPAVLLIVQSDIDKYIVDENMIEQNGQRLKIFISSIVINREFSSINKHVIKHSCIYRHDNKQ